jgi:hypothetical protein
MMQTLLNERFAPITSSVGFLRLDLDEAVEALSGWRRSLVHGRVSSSEVETGFPDCLHYLEPLTAGARPRELLAEASDGWTAYFDCSLRGTDAVSAISYLARKAACQGLAIETVPHTVGTAGVRNGRYGSVQFQMFGPLKTHFINYVRTIAVAFDGSRWIFSTSGTEQWFEETETYSSRRVRDRFTSEMLGRYCKALDLDVFDPGTYGPRAALVESEVKMPSGAPIRSLTDVQRWLEIVPGKADGLPG